MTRLGRIIGLLALAAALSACSAIKFAYNNIGEVAYWWLDSYVEFSDEQSLRVREDLTRLHLWHRTNELPRFGNSPRRGGTGTKRRHCRAYLRCFHAGVGTTARHGRAGRAGSGDDGDGPDARAIPA